MNTKFILYLLAALLLMFIIQGVFFGIFMFVMVLKNLIIAGVIAGILYFLSRNKKQG